MVTTPRRWFQIHLSTCIVLMFVTGVILWTNMKVAANYDLEDKRSMVPQLVLTTQDWPFAVRVEGYDFYAKESLPVEWLLEHLFCDLVVAALILFIVAFIFEWLIRRREAHKL